MAKIWYSSNIYLFDGPVFAGCVKEKEGSFYLPPRLWYKITVKVIDGAIRRHLPYLSNKGACRLPYLFFKQGWAEGLSLFVYIDVTVNNNLREREVCRMKFEWDEEKNRKNIQSIIWCVHCIITEILEYS